MRHLKHLGLGGVGILCVVAGLAVAGVGPAFGTNDKITICHVAGLASDPANHITLHLPPSAVYANPQGQGGHFLENGTTQAGHENDSFGPCQTPPPTTTETTPTETEPPPTTTETTPTETTPTDTTPTETTPTESTPTTPTPPPPPPRTCPDGGPPNAGKDGQVPGSGNTNDDCDRSVPPSPPTTSTTTQATPPAPPPASVTPPPVTSSAGPITQEKPPAKETPKPKDPPVIVKVEKKPKGVVKITTSDGKTHTGIMGSG